MTFRGLARSADREVIRLAGGDPNWQTLLSRRRWGAGAVTLIFGSAFVGAGLYVLAASIMEHPLLATFLSIPIIGVGAGVMPVGWKMFRRGTVHRGEVRTLRTVDGEDGGHFVALDDGPEMDVPRRAFERLRVGQSVIVENDRVGRAITLLVKD
jgi:hypothetical protein